MSTGTTFPMYAKTDNPHVCEAVRETERRREEFLAKARDMSIRLTGEPGNGFFNGWDFDKLHLVGFRSGTVLDGNGRWTQPKSGVTRPYSNNPLRAEMSAIHYRAAELPGRGNVMWGGGRMGTGTIFEHGGHVYSGLSFTPDLTPVKAEQMVEFGWVEIMPSEFHKAMEDENARRALLESKEPAQ